MINETTNYKYKTNFKKRAIATIIDYGIFFLLIYIYIMFFGEENNQGGKTVSGLLFLPIPIYWFIYFVVIEASYGATLAHQAMYLKVLTLERKEIYLGNAFRRHILDLIEIPLYGIPAIIAIIYSEKKQRIGDMFANTIVVDTTDREQYPEEITTIKQ